MSTVKLKNVIHFYIGQEMVSYFGQFEETDIVYGVIGDLAIVSVDEDGNSEGTVDMAYKHIKGKEPKLVLRRISSATAGELTKIAKIEGLANPLITRKNNSFIITDDSYMLHINDSGSIYLTKYGNPESLSKQNEILMYMLKQGFDMFGLIESDQAIAR